jgi:FkbM family methyltransferase
MKFLHRFKSAFTSEPASFMEVERRERMFYLEYLRDGMTVFDVGANVGELTLMFARLVNPGSVHAFEASAAVFKRLSTVCGAVGPRNVVLNHLALSDRQGSVLLYVYEDALSSFNSQAKRPLANYGLDFVPVGVESVPAQTIDTYCEMSAIEHIDLLKIDVEGAEYQVMLGAEGMLRAKNIACVIFEFGQTTFDMGNDPEQIERFLKDVGYKLRNVIERDGIFPGRDSVENAKFSMLIATPM